MKGIIVDVILGLSHNNDQEMLKLTKTDQFLEHADVWWLVDRDYTHIHLVVPDDRKYDKEWNNTQKGLRSVVETVIGCVKAYSPAGSKFRQSPELQQLALLTIYNIVNMRLKEYPL